MVSKPDLWLKIQTIDLNPIAYNFLTDEALDMEADTVHVRTRKSKLAQTEEDYRRFLYLCVAYPDQQIVPSLRVDEFWHFHILDTVKYLDDCNQIAGRMIHHYPYLGKRSPKDHEHLLQKRKVSLGLEEFEFGTLLSDKDAALCGENPPPDNSVPQAAAALCGGSCGGDHVTNARAAWRPSKHDLIKLLSVDS